MKRMVYRSAIPLLLAPIVALSCGDGSSAVSDTEASVPLVQPPCPGYRPVDQEALALARRVIDAAQAWDVAALCALVGVAQVPNGLVRYHAAIEAGLPDGLEIVSKKVDEETAQFNFAIPAAGGPQRLGLAFHRQGGGWALVTASYLDR